MNRKATPSHSEDYSHPYWLEVPLVVGKAPDFTQKSNTKASVVVIGSGLSGASCGYFLNKVGFEDVLIVDYKPENSASYRNCGHILYGTVESMHAMVEIHGKEKARELWDFSVKICDMVQDTIQELGIDADYKKDGYLVNAISEVEDGECRESVKLLNSMGFQSDYVDAETVRKLGFKKCFGARYESGSAQAHPVKFRNGIMNAFLKSGGRYTTGIKVLSIDENPDGVILTTDQGEIHADAAIIAANAYTPLFSGFFKSRGLIDPFRGQIITSKPLKHDFKVKYPHSFDHGYEYALVSPDNRLILGGWRQNSETLEMGTYSLGVNPKIELGLQQFAKDYYDIKEEIEWEFSWSGIMAASRTGMPFIGNTTSPRIYACAAYTGHGFSWAHGSAHLLADIIAGNPVPPVAANFNPRLH